MKLITISDLKQPRRLKKQLKSAGELLLTSDGRPVAMLLSVDANDDLEEVLVTIREAKARRALLRIRRQARHNAIDRMSPVEIDKEVAASRASKRHE